MPVLFATQEGLYLRILDSELATQNKEAQDLEAGKNNMWTIDPQFLTEICDLKIESQTFVSHFSDGSNEEVVKHEDYDEGDHDSHSNQEHDHEAHNEKKIKKSGNFRNTVLDIGQQMNESDSGNSQSSEHKEYRAVRQRKMTGMGDRGHHYHDDHDKKQVIGLAAVGLLLTILASILAIMAQRKRWYHQRFPQTIFVNIFDIIFVHIEIDRKMVVASRQASGHIPIAR